MKREAGLNIEGVHVDVEFLDQETADVQASERRGGPERALVLEVIGIRGRFLEDLLHAIEIVHMDRREDVVIAEHDICGQAVFRSNLDCCGIGFDLVVEQVSEFL
jgi:hypothetical protein